tara:strand:- start:575 stop:1117 length:543 start_codon:yes stop_codon:yes gene_type:complete
MGNVGAIGGDSNQIRGGSNSVGWWFGNSGPLITYIAVSSYVGLLFSMLVFPYIIVCVGLRGPKAPSWLSTTLAMTDGHIPRLSNKNRFHFFISKHEARKKIALSIAQVLKEAGFKVWISQHQAMKGNSIDRDAMQLGVGRSECILLLMTKGIFDKDRFWVTHTEISYGVNECEKPLLCIW